MPNRWGESPVVRQYSQKGYLVTVWTPAPLAGTYLVGWRWGNYFCIKQVYDLFFICLKRLLTVGPSATMTPSLLCLQPTGR